MRNSVSRRKTISGSDLESFLCDISDDNIQNNNINDENKCNSMKSVSKDTLPLTKDNDIIKNTHVMNENNENIHENVMTLQQHDDIKNDNNTPCKKIEIVHEIKKRSPIIELKVNVQCEKTVNVNPITLAVRNFYMKQIKIKTNNIEIESKSNTNTNANANGVGIEMGRDIFLQTGYNILPDRKLYPDKYMNESGTMKDSQCLESKRTLLLSMGPVLTLAEGDRKNDTEDTELFTRCKVLKTRSATTRNLLQKQLSECKLSQPMVQALQGAVYCYQDVDHSHIVPFNEYEMRYLVYLDSKTKTSLNSSINSNGNGSETPVSLPVSPFSKCIPKSPVCCNENGLLILPRTDGTDQSGVGYSTSSTEEPEVELDLIELDYSNSKVNVSKARGYGNGTKGKASSRRYTLSPTTSRQELLECCNEEEDVGGVEVGHDSDGVDVESNPAVEVVSALEVEVEIDVEVEGVVVEVEGVVESSSPSMESEEVEAMETAVEAGVVDSPVPASVSIPVPALVPNFDPVDSLAFDMCQADVVTLPMVYSPLPLPCTPSSGAPVTAMDGGSVGDSDMMFASEYNYQNEHEFELNISPPPPQPAHRQVVHQVPNPIVSVASDGIDAGERDMLGLSTPSTHIHSPTATHVHSPNDQASRKRSREVRPVAVSVTTPPSHPHMGLVTIHSNNTNQTHADRVIVDMDGMNSDSMICSISPDMTPTSGAHSHTHADTTPGCTTSKVNTNPSPSFNSSSGPDTDCNPTDCNPFGSPSPGAVRYQMVHQMNSRRQSMDVTDLEGLLDEEDDVDVEEVPIEVDVCVDVVEETVTEVMTVEVMSVDVISATSPVQHSPLVSTDTEHVQVSVQGSPVDTIVPTESTIIPTTPTPSTTTHTFTTEESPTTASSTTSAMNEEFITDTNTEPDTETAYYRYMVRMEMCKWKYHWEVCSQHAIQIAKDKYNF